MQRKIYLKYIFLKFLLIRNTLFAETPKRREQLRQAVHVGEDGPHADGQAVHDEPRPNGVHGLLVPQPRVRPAHIMGSTSTPPLHQHHHHHNQILFNKLSSKKNRKSLLRFLLSSVRLKKSHHPS